MCSVHLYTLLIYGFSSVCTVFANELPLVEIYIFGIWFLVWAAEKSVIFDFSSVYTDLLLYSILYVLIMCTEDKLCMALYQWL